jgi:hypothetical protein
MLSSPLGSLSSVNSAAIGTLLPELVDPHVELRGKAPWIGVCTGMGRTNGMRSGADTALMLCNGE